MKSKKILWGTVILIILSAGIWALTKSSSHPKRGIERVATATEGSIEESVEATGSVSPLNRVEIKPPIQGRIEKLLFDEGDTTKAGHILAWMSSSDRAAILDAARAKSLEELRHWEDAYKPTPIVAPLSGVIILRNVVVGQTVDPSTILFAMSDSLIVTAQVDESDIGKIHVGMPARITLDAYSDRSVEGKVFDILYEGKNVSNVIQYGVKIRPLQVPSYYRSQMTANVSFIVNKKDHAILVPAKAVRENTDGTKQVLVPGPNGKPVPQEVKTGIESEERIEIISGLASGDKVLLMQGRYIPQQAPQSSPLTFGGRSQSSSNSGQAPRPRRNASN